MTQAPSFANPDHANSPQHRGERWALAALALLLLVQLGWQTRDALAAQPKLRPLLESACSLLHCTLPIWHEPSAFSMLSRDVIAPPDQPGVLRVQASFRNDARWTQAWPTLVLQLSDVNGHTAGARRFMPSEYLGHTPAGTGIAPAQATQIAFDIHEPASSVVAFDFRFE